MQHRVTTTVIASEDGSTTGTSVTSTSFQIASNAVAINTTLGTVTDADVPVAFTVANLKSCILLANKDCTIEVNATSSAVVTINLKAGLPLLWDADAGYTANPFTGITTVSHFYVTTSGSTKLQILIIAN